jgi:transcriptional regulator with XRE-family HTH domain
VPTTRRRKPDPFIALLETYRVAQGITVAKMCQDAGLRSHMWHTYKIGNQQPSVISLRALTQALGLELTVVETARYRPSAVPVVDVKRLQREFGAAIESVQRIGVLLEEVGDRLLSHTQNGARHVPAHPEPVGGGEDPGPDPGHSDSVYARVPA